MADGPPVAIVVLTGWGDAEAGIQALARGAQDYLVKGEVDGRTIARSIRFAVERKRSQLTAAALTEAQLRQQEQHRLERALLVEPAGPAPRRRSGPPATSPPAPGVVSGDFFDGIELPDGTLRFVIGDVAGHGTDEAALGISLRAGWRSLVLSGLDPSDGLRALEEFLLTERPRGDEFATVCDLTIAPDLRTVVRAQRRPPAAGPRRRRRARATAAAGRRSGIRMGDGAMPGTAHELGERWSLRRLHRRPLRGPGPQRRRSSRSTRSAPRSRPRPPTASVDTDALITSFARRSIDGWRDDVALVVVIERPPRTGRAVSTDGRRTRSLKQLATVAWISAVVALVVGVVVVWIGVHQPPRRPRAGPSTACSRRWCPPRRCAPAWSTRRPASGATP